MAGLGREGVRPRPGSCWERMLQGASGGQGPPQHGQIKARKQGAFLFPIHFLFFEEEHAPARLALATEKGSQRLVFKHCIFFLIS